MKNNEEITFLDVIDTLEVLFLLIGMPILAITGHLIDVGMWMIIGGITLAVILELTDSRPMPKRQIERMLLQRSK